MGHRRSILAFIAMFALIASLSLVARGLGAQESTYTVSGRLIGGPPILRGRQGASLTISLDGNVSRPVRPGIIYEENPKRVSLRARVESDGAFAFSNIPPGTYRLTTYVATAEQQSIPTVVVTNRDVPGVKVILVRDDVVTSRNNLSLAWSLPGPWSGVASAPRDGAIYTGVPGDPGRLPPFASVAPVAHIREIDFSGKTLREIPTAGFGSTKIVLARLSASNDPAFLLFESFPDGVHALDRNGNLLWTDTAVKGGVYDIAVMEPHGNAFDEVVISYYGRQGIHVLNSRGEVLWKMKSDSWNPPVAAGDVLGEGKPQVVTISDAGHLQILNSTGTLVSDLGSEARATTIRVGKFSPNDPTATILSLVVQAQSSTVAASALSGTGKTKWAASLHSNITPPMVYSASLAPGKPWLAVSLEGGQIYVLDAAQGAIIANIDGQTWLPEVSWVASMNGTVPRLIVSTHDVLRAYTVAAK